MREGEVGGGQCVSKVLSTQPVVHEQRSTKTPSDRPINEVDGVANTCWIRHGYVDLLNERSLLPAQRPTSFRAHRRIEPCQLTEYGTLFVAYIVLDKVRSP
jgi:hypothetical protein